MVKELLGCVLRAAFAMWRKQSQFAEKNKGTKPLIFKSYISDIPKTSFTSIHLEVWSYESQVLLEFELNFCNPRDPTLIPTFTKCSFFTCIEIIAFVSLSLPLTDHKHCNVLLRQTPRRWQRLK